MIYGTLLMCLCCLIVRCRSLTASAPPPTPTGDSADAANPAASPLMTPESALGMIKALSDVSVDTSMIDQLTCIQVVVSPDCHPVQEVRRQINAFRSGTTTIFKCLKLVAGDMAVKAIGICNASDAEQLTQARVARLVGGLDTWCANLGQDDNTNVRAKPGHAMTLITVWSEVSALSAIQSPSTQDGELHNMVTICATAFTNEMQTMTDECNTAVLA